MNTLNFYKCLADETRLKIMLMLTQDDELCVCELTEALEAIQPKISRHLAQLKQCKLIQDRRQGQWVFYSLSEDMPKWAKTVLLETLGNNHALLAQPQHCLANMTSRPARECC